MKRLFVYGSLKKGFQNDAVLKHVKAQYLGDATLRMARMYSLGPYPAIVLDGSEEETVSGELYDVPADGVKLLDAFEGHPWYYRRTDTKVQDEHGFAHEVGVYEYAQKGQLMETQRVPDGNWTILRSH